MSQTVKAAYFNALKSQGVPFDKHYREYSTEGLRDAYLKLNDGVDLEGLPPETGDEPVDAGAVAEEPPPASFFFPETEPVNPPPAESASPPLRAADPAEMPGQRQNTLAEDEPLRIDPETGRAWFQEEIPKPAYPKPRSRRVLTYVDNGTKTEQVRVGNYVETFEVAGDGPGRTAEVKITLPSYQVGIYKDPRFPFRVHTYNGAEGFDLFEVRNYYGGAELVPADCKLIYVENVLCYDVRSVVRSIETEYRQLVLAGKVE